jgi:hypothetical protein
MADETQFSDGSHDLPADSPSHQLSGRVIPWLSLPEQFVLWALRRRLAAGCPAPADPVLARGFLLSFGLACCEQALREFEVCFSLLATRPRRDIVLCPIGCGCVSVDEELLLQLLVPTPGSGVGEPRRDPIAASLVQAEAVVALLDACASFRRRIDGATALKAEGARRLPAAAARVLH